MIHSIHIQLCMIFCWLFIWSCITVSFYWRKVFSSVQLNIHMLLRPLQWYLCILDTLRPFINVLIIKVNLYFNVPFMTLNVWIMRMSLCSSDWLTSYTVYTVSIYERNDCVKRENGWSWSPCLWSFWGIILLHLQVLNVLILHYIT